MEELMPNNSRKQTAASLTSDAKSNDAKSKGSKSENGKQKPRLNALKDGSAALQNHLENLRFYDFCCMRSDEIEPVKLRFHFLLRGYQAMTTSTPSEEVNEIVTELENARMQLSSTVLGLQFLINKVGAVKAEAEWTGQISEKSERTLSACAGLLNNHVQYCLGINRVNKIETAKAAERARAGQSGGAGQTRATDPDKTKADQRGEREVRESNQVAREDLLVCMIEAIARELSHRQQLLLQIENRFSLGDRTR
jgi:hypothetical protein